MESSIRKENTKQYNQNLSHALKATMTYNEIYKCYT